MINGIITHRCRFAVFTCDFQQGTFVPLKQFFVIDISRGFSRMIDFLDR